MFCTLGFPQVNNAQYTISSHHVQRGHRGGNEFGHMWENVFHLVLVSFSAIVHILISEINCIICLLYTSDAADDMQCVDLGGRRIIKKSAY